MHWLQIFRMASLTWASFCSIVLLGMGAHALSAFDTLFLPSFAWAGLAVATAVLTLVTVPAMLIVDILRMGAFTSLIVVELSWLSFLGVLFLATGGSAAEIASDFWGQCSVQFPADRTVCQETSAAAAFGFLGWLGLWAYTGTLLVLLIVHANRGNYVWRKSVKEAGFEAGIPPATTIAPGMYNDAKPHETGAPNPMAAQAPYQYPPSNSLSPQPTGYSQPTTYSPPVANYGQPMAPPQPTHPQV